MRVPSRETQESKLADGRNRWVSIAALLSSPAAVFSCAQHHEGTAYRPVDSELAGKHINVYCVSDWAADMIDRARARPRAAELGSVGVTALGTS